MPTISDSRVTVRLGHNRQSRNLVLCTTVGQCVMYTADTVQHNLFKFQGQYLAFLETNCLH